MEEKARSDYEFSTTDFVNSFIRVAKTVLVTPGNFYQHMPTTGGYTPPVIFLAVCLGVSGVLSAILAGVNVLLFFQIIIAGVIFSFIGAGVLHLVAQQFFEGKGTYEGVYRVVAYASIVQIISWLTFVSGVFFIVTICVSLYGLYLQIVGLEKVHQITPGQAVVTVLIVFAVYLIMSLVASVPFFGFRM
jgi:hypothetical protein